MKTGFNVGHELACKLFYDSGVRTTILWNAVFRPNVFQSLKNVDISEFGPGKPSMRNKTDGEA